jgi:hypothetical protein
MKLWASLRKGTPGTVHQCSRDFRFELSSESATALKSLRDLKPLLDILIISMTVRTFVS